MLAPLHASRTPIMVYVGQAMWDDIKILGHLVCPFVRMSVCVYVVGRYQKFHGVPHKPDCVYTLGFFLTMTMLQDLGMEGGS